MAKPYRRCMLCPEQMRRKGFCMEHFNMIRTNRKMQIQLYLPDCQVPGCEQMEEKAGLCGRHYNQKARGEEFVLEDPRYVRKECPVHDCIRPAIGRAFLCKVHQKLSWRYRIPEEQIPVLYSPDSKCASCGSPDNLSVDHDHSCCAVNYASCGECNRGMLCRSCNSALGMLKDDPERVRSLLAYIESGSRI